MKRVLAVVACGGFLVAPSQASSSGWGAAGSTTGAGGAWPSVPPSAPPSEHDHRHNGRSPSGDPNAPGMDYGGGSAPGGNSNSYYPSPMGEGGAGTEPDGTTAYAGQGADATAGGGVNGYLDPGYDNPEHREQHQWPPYEPPYVPPPYVPQQTRWTGQQYEARLQEQQHQQHHQQQQQQQMYGHDHFPQYQGTPPSSGVGGDALRLGTKWRSIVSRVKDAVRPGQPSGYGQGGGYRTDNGGSSGWVEGGGGGGGYSPPGSSWVGGANQNAGYASPPGAYGQAQPDTYTGYGRESPGGGYDHRATQQGGYSPDGNDASRYGSSQDQHRHAAPPPAFFDPPGSIDPPSAAQQGGAGQAEGGAWHSAPPSAPAVQQAPAVCSDSAGANDARYEAGSAAGNGVGVGGFGGSGDYQSYYSTNDKGMGSGTSGASTVSGGHGAMGGGLSSQGVQFSEGLPQGSSPALQPHAVGQGWSSSGADSVQGHQQHEQRQAEERRDLEGTVAAPGGLSSPAHPSSVPFSHGPRAVSGDIAPGNGRAAPLPAAAPVPLSAAQKAAIQGQGDEQLPSPSIDPNQSAWTAYGEPRRQGDGGLDGLAAAGPPDVTGKPPEQRTLARESQVERSILSGDHTTASTAAGSAHGTTKSYRPAAGSLLDSMPSSADHGMEKVDWGKGAEEEREDESGETVVVTGGEERLEQQREEEALIRELERMDGIGGGELLNNDVKGSSSPPLLEEEATIDMAVEDRQAMIDEAVEHRLDDLFDSILDEDIDGVDDAEFIPVADNSSPRDISAASLAASIPLQSTGNRECGDTSKLENWSVDEVETREDDLPEPWDTSSHVRLDVRLDSSGDDVSRANEPVAWTYEGGSPYGDVAASDPQEQGSVWREPAASTSPELDPVGSMWGKTGRWESLPPLAVVVSEPEQEEEGGESDSDDDDEAAGSVPLDPIELPPSAATDEIWNDQHLQDQLDAYWEQSRKGEAFAAATGVATSSPLGRQLSTTYGGRLQSTYGPGDWVGKGAAMAQEPLPGAVDGIARSGLVTPRLFQGNQQAPINIYGNVHVHLQQGGQGGDQQSQPSLELSARERYYSQGETSWSGSGRGGQ